jgi:hypothetical protein
MLLGWENGGSSTGGRAIDYTRWGGNLMWHYGRSPKVIKECLAIEESRLLFDGPDIVCCRRWRKDVGDVRREIRPRRHKKSELLHVMALLAKFTGYQTFIRGGKGHGTHSLFLVPRKYLCEGVINQSRG